MMRLREAFGLSARASLTFSSQDLGDSQGDNSVKNISSPLSQDDPTTPARQTPSPSSSAPRLGLNKFAFSGPKVGSSSVSKPAVPISNLGPARVSGLSRGGGKVGGGLRQPSLLQMFARKCPKAQLGGGGGGSS